MKTKFKTLLVAGMGIVLLSSFILKENEPDGKKKHVKMIQVVDGEKTVIDTTFADGIDPMAWVAKHKLECSKDSLKHKKTYTCTIFMDGDSAKMKSFAYAFNGDDGFGPGEADFEMMEGDSMNNDILIMGHPHHGKRNVMFVRGGQGPHGVPMPPMPPAPHIRMVKHLGGNIIDLNAPGIISYKKKDMGNGKEKIEIIREKPEKE